MRWLDSLLVVAALAGMPATLTAQPDLAQQPGFLPDEYLDLMAPDALTVEINLQGAMLRMISAFAGDDDPEFAALVAALHGIRVRSGEFSPEDSAAVQGRIAAGAEWLDSNGWLPMVRVREPGEEIYIYSREQGGDLVGFTIMALEDGEATAVNLIGRIDPNQLVRLIEGLDLDVLEDVELPVGASSEEER